MAAREKSAVSEMRSLVRPNTLDEMREANECVRVEKVEFKDTGVTVVGISADPVPAIKDFATKHNVTVCTLCHKLA
jgi:hypothetical protein